MNTLGLKAVAGLRVVLGAAFLYAGLEKVIATTPFSAAGFLTKGTAGALPDSVKGAIANPSHDLWVAIGSNAGLVGLVNVAVVAGEVAIGACLILGLFTRAAGVLGAVMMILFTVAAWSFANGPFNETFLYAAVAVFLALANAGVPYGLDARLRFWRRSVVEPRLAGAATSIAPRRGDPAVVFVPIDRARVTKR
jgi:thiosulfate dehydrogenase [quinone] large subunit